MNTETRETRGFQWTLPLLAACALLFFLGAVSRGWHASLLDVHEFRQLQTATSAHWLRETGFKLAYETPLFGPPWSIPMEFPLYQAVVAGTSKVLGTGLEPTARGMSVLFFLLALPAVYLLGEIFSLRPGERGLVIACVVMTPLYLFYARTVMIETTALACALWFLAALARIEPGRAGRWALVAALAGVLAALAKVTTFLAFCPPAAALVAWRLWPLRAEPAAVLRRGAWFALPVAVALLAGYAWVRYADAVKLTNPFSTPLTSQVLADWNWGTLDQRLTAKFWSELWHNLTQSIVGETALGVLLIGFALATAPLRRAALFCAGCFLLGPLLFANLHFVHDYYYCATAVFGAAAAGLVLVGVWRNDRLPALARAACLVVFFSAQWLTYHRGYADFMRRTLPQPPAIAAVIAATLPVDEVLAIYGWDWSSEIPYYAQRRALMVPTPYETNPAALEKILAQMPPRKIGALLVRPSGQWHSAAFVQGRVRRFGLADRPVATSEHGELYLRADLMSGAAALRGRDFSGVQFDFEAVATGALAAFPPFPADTLRHPAFSPTPRHGHSQFGVGTGEVDGTPVFTAHAPCELTFDCPAGATTVVFEFGMPEDAHAGDSVTDGVGAEIVGRTAAGADVSLFERVLQPMMIEADRGVQRAEFGLPPGFSGEIILRFTPGADGQLAKDWIYVKSFIIR